MVARVVVAKLVGIELTVSAVVQVVPSVLYSQSWELKPVVVFCMA